MGTKAKLQVWWIPQVPMPAFAVDVPDVATGRLVLEMLADYDAFQFEHHVKPDYCNTGGLRWQHPEGTEGEWYDLDPDDADDVAEFHRFRAI